MATPLKDLYSPAFYKTLSATLAEVIPTFNNPRFISPIFTDDFTEKEWNTRMRHTSVVLQAFLPSDFNQAIKILEKLIAFLTQITR